MKNVAIGVLISFTGPDILGQNLVPNWSFEDHTDCPSDYGQVELCTSWFRSTENNDPTYHTEYLADCGSSMFDVPANTWGYQAAATGQAYMAEVSMAPTVSVDYRENIYAQLIAPLVIGEEYDISFKLSFTDNSRNASDHFGAKFSTTTTFPIDGNCQLIGNEVITDTDEWTLIQGTFEADQAYTHICIGNFIPDALATTTIACPTCPFNLFGYYVDDVCVTLKGLGRMTADCMVPYDPTTGVAAYRQAGPRVSFNTDEFAVSIPMKEDGPLRYKLRDPTGRTIVMGTVPLSGGRASIKARVLTTGIHLLELSRDGWSSVARVAVVP